MKSVSFLKAAMVNVKFRPVLGIMTAEQIYVTTQLFCNTLSVQFAYQILNLRLISVMKKKPVSMGFVQLHVFHKMVFQIVKAIKLVLKVIVNQNIVILI